MHAFTASGAVCGVLAIEATYADKLWAALGWLGLAVLIDAVDGTFARLVDIKHTLPEIDGTLLDNLVDYLNYVVVPAIMVVRGELAPQQTTLALAAAMCLASAFQFCNANAKTPDHYFLGFPSYWNIVAAYAVLLPMTQTATLSTIALAAVLVFVPIKYVYPSRTRRHNRLMLPLTIVWGALLIAGWATGPSDPSLASLLLWLSLIYVPIYVAISLWHTLLPETDPPVPSSDLKPEA